MSFLDSDNVFLSALQPNTSVSTYAVPSDIQLGHGTLSDEMSKAKRVQEQVKLRLAEKSTLPRQNGTSGQYASSEYGSSSAMKYQTYNPGFSSKSFVQTTSRPVMAPRVSQYSSGYSSRSAVDLGQLQRISLGAGGGGGGGGGGGVNMYPHEDMRMGGYQGNVQQQVTTVTRAVRRPDHDTISLRSLHLHNLPQQPSSVTNWVVQDGSDAGSLASERDATLSRQAAFGLANGYSSSSSQMRQYQSSGSMTYPAPMRRSLSGTLARNGGMVGGGEAEVVHTPSFKGPAFRTINRINQRNNRMSFGSMSGTGSMQRQVSSGGSMYGGGGGGGFAMGQVSSGSQGNLMMMHQRQASLPRAMSMKSVHSVGRGGDIFDGQMDMAGSMGNLSGIANLDMATAVHNLSDSDPELQVLGAAYIQHECYNNNDAKQEVRRCKGIGELVRLFNSESQDVQRYATGATRNLIYENMDNKVALIEEGGIQQLIEALKEPDDELRKNITGILWNLSSKDNLKEKMAKEILPELTDKILIPLSGSGDSEVTQSASEADIFYNTTGCLRNLSSVNEKTRQQMRETRGLVDALVTHIQGALQNNKVEDKGVENAVCVLRNLSYQLYTEMPPSALLRLEGPSRSQSAGNSEAIGCFTPKSKKAKNEYDLLDRGNRGIILVVMDNVSHAGEYKTKRKNQDLSTFTEVARVPKDLEWLWHPQVVGLYNRVLQHCEINSTTREAAAGALQNITAGDKRWASVLSRVALEQERMLPVLLDLLRTNNDLELRSLTGFLRNLSRHATDKNDMSTKVVNNLVPKLPNDGHQKEPSSDVVVNICGALNNLVTSSNVAARDITFFDGLQKLVAIKNSHDNSPGKLKAAKAAATVLSNMFQYKKLHKDYKQKGFTRPDFAEIVI